MPGQDVASMSAAEMLMVSDSISGWTPSKLPGAMVIVKLWACACKVGDDDLCRFLAQPEHAPADMYL